MARLIGPSVTHLEIEAHMNVVLVSPPAATPFAPSMGFLALRSYLQANGIETSLIDANVEAIHYAVEPERCRQYIAPIRPGLRKRLPDQIQQGLIATRATDPDQPPPPLDEARADFVLDQLQSIRTDDGFVLSKENFTSELSVINDAVILSSLRMYPQHLSIWGVNGGAVPKSGLQQNPFYHYTREVLVPQIKALSPDLIGISLGHSDQMLYSILLLNSLRASGVDVPVAVGGAYFTNFARIASRDQRTAFPLLDASGKPSAEAAVVGTILGSFDALSGRQVTSPKLTVGIREEGEQALLELCRRLEAGQDLWDQPNLVYVHPDSKDLVYNEVGPSIDGELIPKTDLSGLPMGKKYLSPIAMAPLMTSRGCYWDKCTFCDHAHTLGLGFRHMSPDVIADTMQTYRDDFGVEVAFFCDESFSPAMLRQLTEKLEERDLFMNYGTMCRIEKEFIPLIEPGAKRGLRSLCFGWESACDRVTELMKKGYTRQDSEDLFEECLQWDVRIQFFMMFGFPTETEEEADQTLAYLRENRDRLIGINPMPWMLTSESYLKYHPEEFGIRVNPGCEFTQDTRTFTNVEGIDRAKANEYMDKLETHPDLKRLFATKGMEDYKLLLDLIRTGNRFDPRGD
jgi:anaerobic magnesium-protoporphyrin IX monomethyl ester cyclase